MSNGGQQSSQVQNTSSSNTWGPHPALAPKLENLKESLWSWYADHANAPAYYPGSTVAAPSEQTKSALTALWQRGASGSPVVDAADRSVVETLDGRYLDIAGNPYFQKALAAGFKPQTEQFMEEVVPGLDARFAGAGRYGSGAHAGVTARAVDSLARAQADAAAKASLNAYESERGRMASAAGLAPALAAQDYVDLAALMQVGAANDSEAQRRTDADVARYNYEQTAQPNWYANIARLLQSIYPAGSSSGSGTTYSSGSTSSSVGLAESLLGLGRLGLDAYRAVPSDARLKVDITPVGTLFDGQTVYSYRYKGDPRTQIGLLAQEVERFHPEAVSRHSSGYKMVDYGRAAPRGGLM